MCLVHTKHSGIRVFTKHVLGISFLIQFCAARKESTSFAYPNIVISILFLLLLFPISTFFLSLFLIHHHRLLLVPVPTNHHLDYTDKQWHL
jgi:hypothetical protein